MQLAGNERGIIKGVAIRDRAIEKITDPKIKAKYAHLLPRVSAPQKCQKCGTKFLSNVNTGFTVSGNYGICYKCGWRGNMG